jgi:signal transduction histidine kinase
VEAAQLVVRIAELVLFGGLAIASWKRWRGERDRAGLWAAATFGILASVVVAAFMLDPSSESDAASWLRKFLVAVLLLFPYTLFRYAGEFSPPSPRFRRVAEALTAAVIAWTILLPKLHGDEAPRTAALNVFVFAILVQWTVLSAWASRALWRMGTGQASVARNRMRMLGVGAAMLNFALFLAALFPGDEKSVAPVIVGVIALASGAQFFIGFVPPRVLRILWRTPDSQTLREAEVSLMSVIDPADIGGALLPHVTRLFGGHGSVLVDTAGSVLASSGLTSVEAKAAATAAAGAGDQPLVDSNLVAVPMRAGWLAVRGSIQTPFFGQEEVDLLVGLAVFADLALERGALFARERDAREQAERANAELETFVYSVSHDLKSPLVSLLGFLDYLKVDLEGVDSLSTDTRFFLERISAAGMYMQALIQDLLELSRIGRVQTEVVPVDVGLVVNEAVAELQPGHPDATIEVGALPVIDINPLRVRQLFTNLLNNALVHAGRPDVHVTVSAEEEADGAVTVVVADNGKGVPADYRDKVFGVFERLERQDADTGGTGIGLAVCRKIAEQIGGHISLGDNAPGARLVIRIPAAMVRRGPSTLEVAR